MRFGRNLHRNRIPELASSYIDYHGLKKHIKLGTQHAFAQHQAEVDLTGTLQLIVTYTPIRSNRTQPFRLP